MNDNNQFTRKELDEIIDALEDSIDADARAWDKELVKELKAILDKAVRLRDE